MGEWTLALTSCAAIACIPEDIAVILPLPESVVAKSFTSASGTSVKVVGTRKRLAWFQDDSQHLVTLNVFRPLHKSLIAANELIQSCRLVFDFAELGGFHHENRRAGSKIGVYQRSGMFVFPSRFKVKPPGKRLAAQREAPVEIDCF